MLYSAKDDKNIFSIITVIFVIEYHNYEIRRKVTVYFPQKNEGWIVMHSSLDVHD
jgi:hypothetical protein